MRSYGKGTFASTATSPNEPVDVGIFLGNTRVTMNTGISTFTALAPPYAVGLDDETVFEIWKNKLGTSATLSNATSATTSSATYSKANNDAPLALTGHTITATVTATRSKSVITFKYNNFADVSGSSTNSGTYTYAPYTPTMALVDLTSSAVASAGESEYVRLNFTSPVGGTFVSAKPEGNSWKFSAGTFTMK
jgi:hypothetical protein